MFRMFNISFSLSVLLLVASEGVVLTACYLIAASLPHLYAEPEVELLVQNELLQITSLVLAIMLGLYLNDLYQRMRFRSTLGLVQKFCLVLGAVFMLQVILRYARIDLQVPVWTIVVGSGLALIVDPLWRRWYFSRVRKSLPIKKLLFWGTSPATEKVIERLADSELDMMVLGYASTAAQVYNGFGASPCLGSAQDIEQIIHEYHPDCIVLSAGEPCERMLVQRLLGTRHPGIALEDVSTTYEVVFRRVLPAELQRSQADLSVEVSPGSWIAMVQNVYSYGLALIGVLLALPVMLIVALLVKLTSPGPVFFRQTRVGKNGVNFQLFKFRSMRADAEAKTGPVWAQKNDPRVTPVGRWLRRLRLDELPQLFNVLRGEMTMVGPRPERPEFVSMLADKIPFYDQRHRVKPGITGWAQISHKYGDTIEDTKVKLGYDLYYIKNMTPALDALVLFHTIRVILLQRGAQ